MRPPRPRPDEELVSNFEEAGGQGKPKIGHFEQAAELVTEEKVAEGVVCGPDLEWHIAAMTEYVEAARIRAPFRRLRSDRASREVPLCAVFGRDQIGRRGPIAEPRQPSRRLRSVV